MGGRQRNCDQLLTHVQLTYKAGHVVVLVVEGQQLPGELGLVLDDEATAILEGQKARG